VASEDDVGAVRFGPLFVDGFDPGDADEGSDLVR
jgi:hypothetical protein